MLKMPWLEYNLPANAGYPYPFFRFFSPSFEVTNEILPAIQAIDRWIYDPSGRGLLLCGQHSGKSHLLYLIATYLYVPIKFADDINRECLDSLRDSRYNDNIDRYAEMDVAIDDLGSERVTKQLKPLDEIIHQKWRKGRGILAATGSSQLILDTYGDQQLLNIIETSCEIIKLPTRG